jgi:hypothetical protein
MKKYALVIVAVVMVLTASAFIVANKSNTKATTSSYWFLMDASGTSVTTTQVSNPDNLCPEQLDEPDCAREYSESQTEIISGVRHVKASEVDNFIDYRSKDE